MNQLKTGDYAIFAIYFVFISWYGYYIYKRKKSSQQGAKDFLNKNIQKKHTHKNPREKCSKVNKSKS